MKRILTRLILTLALMSTLQATGARAMDRVDTTIYQAVINHEWQYSLWPADRELPLGWEPTGFQGLKEDVLAFIQRVWTDMRPRSLREKMNQMNHADRCIVADLPPHRCQP